MNKFTKKPLSFIMKKALNSNRYYLLLIFLDWDTKMDFSLKRISQ